MSEEKTQGAVAIDSMVLVWGVGVRKGGSREGPQEKIRRAGYLFKKLERDQAQVIVPAIVVSEYMTPIPSSAERSNVLAAIMERFIVAPFDARCAAVAADLYNHGRATRKMNRARARTCLRSDALIVATAHVHGARLFYSEDSDCLKMAGQVMTAKRLPKSGELLFDELEES